jgi:hypothetical protein
LVFASRLRPARPYDEFSNLSEEACGERVGGGCDGPGGPFGDRLKTYRTARPVAGCSYDEFSNLSEEACGKQVGEGCDGPGGPFGDRLKTYRTARPVAGCSYDEFSNLSKRRGANGLVGDATGRGALLATG